MKNIVIIPNETKDKGLIVTKALTRYLEKNADIYMDEYFIDKIEGVNF